MSAGAAREVEAFRDLAMFPPRTHLSAWMLGAWPARLLGTQSDIRSGWAVNYSISFAAQLPLDQEPPGAPRSFDGGAFMWTRGLDAQGAAKRRRHGAERQDS